MVNTTAADTKISGMIGIYYSKVFEKRLEANLVYDKWGEQRPIPKNSGATVVWHQLNNVAVGYDITDGDTPAASAVSARKISAVLSYKGDLKAITDQVDMTAVCPVVKETVAAMGYGGALTLDAFVADKIGFGSAASTGVTFAASVTYPSVFSQGFPVLEANSETEYWPDATTNIATSLQNGFFSTLPIIDHVRIAVTKLKNRDVMEFDDGLYRGVVSPVISDYLRRDADFATWMAFKYPEKMVQGELGVIEGVRFQESTKAINVPVKASAWSTTYATPGGTLYGTLIFGQGAYGVTKLGSKDYEVNVIPTNQIDKSDPLGQRAYVSYKMAVAAAILNPSCGILWTYFKSN
ncbi:MAG TPA: N4-gp56 family major capsid protein [Sphingomicrobium sp.]|nr:N4-gp56 family major capsid protein [Sphingomicrobium sp.]